MKEFNLTLLAAFVPKSIVIFAENLAVGVEFLCAQTARFMLKIIQNKKAI